MASPQAQAKVAHALEGAVIQPYVAPGPVAQSFFLSEKFVRGLMGPVGSGKSSACIMELWWRATEQKPFNGVRRTRFAILRNHYPELKSTTIKTFSEWLPHIPVKWDSPIVAHGRFPADDGTIIDVEFIFISLDRPEETGKIRGLELTGAMLNEASEMAKEALDMVTQRVGRFPPKKWGGPTWSGVIMDTNPPDTAHWYYALAEKETPPGFEFFRQPGGLVELDGEWKPNPAAENLHNLPNGVEYYLRQVAGKRKEWVKIFLAGEYGVSVDGKAVYPEYNDEIHCRHTPPMSGIPIVVGLDYGRTPAAAFVQVTPRGQFRVIDELCSEDMSIGTFAEDVLKPHIATNYRDYNILFVGDPAGLSAESDERNAFDVLALHGVVAVPAHTNRLTGRLEAVRHYLNRMSDGQPAFCVDPKAETLREGLIGKYHFKYVQSSGGRVKETPEKDKWSHPHDALQYAALYATMENVNAARFHSKINYPALGIA